MEASSRIQEEKFRSNHRAAARLLVASSGWSSLKHNFLSHPPTLLWMLQKSDPRCSYECAGRVSSHGHARFAFQRQLVSFAQQRIGLSRGWLCTTLVGHQGVGESPPRAAVLRRANSLAPTWYSPGIP